MIRLYYKSWTTYTKKVVNINYTVFRKSIIAAVINVPILFVIMYSLKKNENTLH